MTGCLLDTNVVSGLVSPAPDRQVVAFLASRVGPWLRTVVLCGPSFWVELLPAGRRRRELRGFLAAILARPDASAHSLWPPRGSACGEAVRPGRTAAVVDALIAATVGSHDFSVATRSVSGFEVLGVDVVSP